MFLIQNIKEQDWELKGIKTNKKMKENRNSKLLKSFVDYCGEHPTYRFWQALLSWSGLPYILWANNHHIDKETEYGDTFYWENKTN